MKDAEGKVKIKETDDVSTRRGIISGGTLGLIIGIVIGGPVGGLVVGGPIGAFTAKKIDLGISNEKIKSIAADLKDNSSALFLQIEKAEKKELLIALLRDSGGNIVELDLSDDTELELNEQLSEYSGRQ